MRVRIFKIVLPNEEENPALYKKLRKVLLKINQRLYGEGCCDGMSVDKLFTWDVFQEWYDLPQGALVLPAEDIYPSNEICPESLMRELYLWLIDDSWMPPEKVLKYLKVYEVRAWTRLGSE